MNNTLIPVSDEAVAHLNEVLSTNHFPNVEQFINMYNVGMLRPDFEIVKLTENLLFAQALKFHLIILSYY